MVTPHRGVVKVHFGPLPFHSGTPPLQSPSLPFDTGSYTLRSHLLTTSKVCRSWRVHSTPTAHQAMAALPRVRAFLNMSVQGLQPKSPWSWPSWKLSLLRLGGRYQSVPQQYLRHQETLSTMTLRLFEFCIKKKKKRIF